MRIEHDGPVGPRPTSNDDTQAATAAAAAAAARDAAGRITDPAHRAAAGWALAGNRELPPDAGQRAEVVADAGTNARNAINRTDLPPAQAEQVRTVVERLGNALVDGTIDPHVNNQFRQHLYDLATQPVDSSAFRGAQAQLTRAAEVLDQAQLARGTRLAYDAGASQPGVARAGLPILDVPNIDADLYFRTGDGVLHIEGVKSTPQTLANEAQRATVREGQQPSQLGRQAQWAQAGTPDAPRALGLYVFDAANGTGFHNLLDDGRMAQLDRLLGTDADTRRIVVGERSYSLNDLKAIAADADAMAPGRVDALRAQHLAAGQPESTFNTGEAYRQFYRETLASPGEASRVLGQQYGAPRPALERLAPADLPSARQGGLFGAAAAGGLTLLRVGSDGNLSAEDAREVAGYTAFGGGVGALTAAGERLLTPAIAPVIDRAVGTTVQNAVTRATAALPAVTAESAAGFGATARSLAPRLAGATAVGTVISTGISAYENRDGLARGDSQAIGNVTADTVVAAGSIAAATATGAAIGSVVPVAGTAVGAVVGLAVGVGITYGAQISGARDAIANTVSGWVDGIKGWF